MLKKGELTTNKIVGTILTNTGFEEFMNKNSIEVVKVPVGDKNVYYKLTELEEPFGGEPSGHLIFANLCKTGDGILAALRFISIIINQGIKASEVSKMFHLTPSKEVNLNLNGKTPNIPKAEQLIIKIKSQIPGVSNITVRKSGTEDKLRIVVNANLDEKTLENYANELANATQS
jgi:phosphoglucosamine mutase